VKGLDAGADDFIAKPFKWPRCARRGARRVPRDRPARRAQEPVSSSKPRCGRRHRSFESLLPICMFSASPPACNETLAHSKATCRDTRYVPGFSHGCCPVCLAAGRMDRP